MTRAVVAILLAAAMATGAVAREWTDASGQQRVEARFVGMKDGKVLLRLAENGKVVAAPLTNFSAGDQDYVKKLAGLEGEAAKEEAVKIVGDDRFSQILRENPNDPQNWYMRGLARLNRKQYDDALADFEQALKLDPKLAAAYDGRGQVYAAQEKFVDAHEDFSKAIELNPKLPSAYRNRAENLSSVARTEEGRQMFIDAAEGWRKKVASADASNTRNTPWQPLNTTAGNTTRPFTAFAKADLEKAEFLEREYGRHGGYGGYGGYGGGYGGVTVVGPGGPGVAVTAPGVLVKMQGLDVFPKEVVQGEKITLVANESELKSSMPIKKGENGRPEMVQGPNGKRYPARQDVGVVDFYRDVDGDLVLDPGKDQLLGSDTKSDDGYSLEVSTGNFPPGPQNYFAIGREREPTEAEKKQYEGLVEKLQKAAERERKLAEAAQKAAEAEGLTPEQTESLESQQDEISDSARDLYDDVAKTSPEVGKALKAAANRINRVKQQLGYAKKTPGESSKQPASRGSEQAEKAADEFERAAEALEQYAANGGTAGAASTAAAASNQVKPGPGQVADADGPGNGGDGDDDGDDDGGYDRDDDDGVDIYVDNDDDRDRVRVYDRDLVDVNRRIYDDPDDYFLLRRRADLLAERGGYDLAVREYSNLIDREVPSADLFYNRGCAHLAAGRLELAEEDFTKSIKLDETRNLAWTNRGTTYARMGDFDKAVENFNQALVLNPADGLAYRNRALAYKKLGQIDKYEADLAKARELQAAE